LKITDTFKQHESIEVFINIAVLSLHSGQPVLNYLVLILRLSIRTGMRA
jgi:hypothetical protein